MIAGRKEPTYKRLQHVDGGLTRGHGARRGGRVAEGAPLLREYTGDRIVGSNPILSAIFFHTSETTIFSVSYVGTWGWLRMLPVLLPVLCSRITRDA